MGGPCVAPCAESRRRVTLSNSQSRIKIALITGRPEIERAGRRGTFENRRGRFCCGFHQIAKSLTLILIITRCVSDCFAAAARTGSVSLTEAGEQGTFNVGPTEANLARSFEPAVVGDVLRLKYTIPAGSTVGVFAKARREKPEPVSPTIVRLGIGPDAPAPAGRVELKRARPARWSAVGGRKDSARTACPATESNRLVGAARIPSELRRRTSRPHTRLWRKIASISSLRRPARSRFSAVNRTRRRPTW